MKQTTFSRAEVIMAGIGGMGVLVAGRVLSGAAFRRYKSVSWVPSYQAAMRGGSCECTVIFSDEQIASPILDQAQAVMVLDGSQFKAFEPRVRPGGVMIVESAGLRDKPIREDFKLLPVSGLEMAVSMGDSLINNLILLGVYVEVTKAITAELIEEELNRRYGGREAVVQRNTEAFRRGLELAKTVEE